jgi:2-polyprenyl-6-methoxyphenol hydroxylase-like FAD-dependent oxidoreductase
MLSSFVVVDATLANFRRRVAIHHRKRSPCRGPGVAEDAGAQAQCCIVGGGPAGMMLGYLLARAGVRTIVLEKHGDFLRDFRGDTIHPSTLEVMHELGLLEEFLARPHQEVRRLSVSIGREQLTLADFSHLPTHCRFVALMPQWHFLDFVAEQAKQWPSFRLRLRSEAKGLLVEGDRVVGVRGSGEDGEFVIHADLIVGADGRHSTIREQAGLVVENLGAPMDVLWMRLPKRPDDPPETFGRVGVGHLLVMIDRGDYWQCAFIIAKGTIDSWRAGGIESLRAVIASVAPSLRARLEVLKSYDDVRLLTVTVDRLRRWHRPGLLAIGDAAHAMSPIGGVGVNLAIQDAIAAANALAEPLREGLVTTAHLESIERRRSLPTRVTQWIQVTIQNRVVRGILESREEPTVPGALRLLHHVPFLQRLPARLIGLGVRPEHVRSARHV